MKMNRDKLQLAFLALFFLILTIGFGCSSGKAFKSGTTYQCDEGRTFALEFYEKVDIAFLMVPGKTSSLHRTSSASGVRKYTDGNTILWIKGESASIEIDGRTEFKNCLPKSK